MWYTHTFGYLAMKKNGALTQYYNMCVPLNILQTERGYLKRTTYCMTALM